MTTVAQAAWDYPLVVDDDREVPYDWDEEHDRDEGPRLPPYVEYVEHDGIGIQAHLGRPEHDGVGIGSGFSRPERDGCEL